tara:strand:+ start:165 stop:548 length:384 start_codon:yes stop_codon:yes gene_type:complete
MNQKFVHFVEGTRCSDIYKGKTLKNKIEHFLDIDIKLFRDGIVEKKNDSILDKTVYLVFENHPNSLDMTYGEHMRVSLYFAFNSLMAFFIFLVHAFLPILFNHKGTELLEYTIELSKAANNLNKKNN